MFVFDSRVAPESIRLLTREGATAPEITGQTFTLPFGVAPLSVAAVTAESTDGEALVFQPEWDEANVATVEEEL